MQIGLFKFVCCAIVTNTDRVLHFVKQKLKETWSDSPFRPISWVKRTSCAWQADEVNRLYEAKLSKNLSYYGKIWFDHISSLSNPGWVFWDGDGSGLFR